MSTTVQMDTQPGTASLREQFLLDPSVVFLNHGSFGACPAPVFDTYQRWQREFESNPVHFVDHVLRPALGVARERLAVFVGASAEQLVFVPNATYAINAVARSIKLETGDEVLGTNHEYGAVNNTWRFVCQKQGAHYVQATFGIPVSDKHSIVEAIWSQVTERTRVICISHITAPTALILPIEEICRRAREAGIVTVIDGAHALGQIDLALNEIGVDYYTGNAHKWLCAPKGSAFLYSHVGPETELEPLVVSHGWSNTTSNSRLDDYYLWTGTMDPSAYLSVPAAIDFVEEHDWSSVRASCHALASTLRRELEAFSGRESVCPDSTEWYSQMFTAFLPEPPVEDMRGRLWDEYRIIVPVHRFGDEIPLVRVSIQAYNTQEDADRLLTALNEIYSGT